LTSLGPLFVPLRSNFSVVVVAVLETWRLYRAHLGPNDGINHPLVFFWVPGCSRHPRGGDDDGKEGEQRENAGGHVEVVDVVLEGVHGCQ